MIFNRYIEMFDSIMIKKSIIEGCIVCYENIVSQKIEKIRQCLFYCRSIFYHFIGDPCEFGNKCRDGCLWIYECLKGIYYIFSIKLYRCYFGDMMSVFAESSCFNIDDDVVFIVQNDWYNNKKLLMQFLNSGPEGVEPSTRSFGDSRSTAELRPYIVY